MRPGILKEDLKNLSFVDDHFDYIISQHILEHIKDDDKALTEIIRVLKPNGKLLLSLSLYDNNESINFEKPDSQGHYWLYGKDIIKKLNQYGFRVKVFSYNQKSNGEIKYIGNNLQFVTKNYRFDSILECTKPRKFTNILKSLFKKT